MQPVPVPVTVVIEVGKYDSEIAPRQKPCSFTDMFQHVFVYLSGLGRVQGSGLHMFDDIRICLCDDCVTV